MTREKNPKYESMSLEELKANMEKSKKELEQAMHNKNILEQRKKLIEKKERSHRLIVKGAEFEKAFPPPPPTPITLILGIYSFSNSSSKAIFSSSLYIDNFQSEIIILHSTQLYYLILSYFFQNSNAFQPFFCKIIRKILLKNYSPV